MTHEFKLTEKQAAQVFQQISSHCSALKNWIASKVEDDKFEEAKTLTKELREYQVLYAKFNITALQNIK